MFTLKCAPTGSAPGSATWIGGIAAVHRIATSTIGEYREAWDDYLLTHGTRDLASLLNRGAALDIGYEESVTLLHCEQTNGIGPDFYVVTALAWLLGPDGQTIDRLAP